MVPRTFSTPGVGPDTYRRPTTTSTLAEDLAQLIHDLKERQSIRAGTSWSPKNGRDGCVSKAHADVVFDLRARWRHRRDPADIDEARRSTLELSG